MVEKKIWADEEISTNKFFRVFHLKDSVGELYWHRDDRERVVQVIAGQGWSLQKDNFLPLNLFVGNIITIEKLSWHRLLPGLDDLKLLITEL